MDTVSSTGSNGSYANESPQPLLCLRCNVSYPNIHELLTHQVSAMHFACNQCKSCFGTEHDLRDHKRKHHRPDLDLECFGCHLHFNRAARFWQHLEGGECKVVFPSDVVRLRENNLKFAEQLELRKFAMDDTMQCEESHIKGDDTWASYSEGETAPTDSVVTPDFSSRLVPTTIPNAHPLHYRIEDFPALPTKPKASTAPGFYRGQKRNAWSNRGAAVSRNNDTPTSYNAVPPPASYDILPVSFHSNSIPILPPRSNIRVVRSPANPTEEGFHGTTSSGRVIDTVDPNYNPAVFYNSVLEKFVCPYKSCGKKYSNAFVLTRHLESPAHGGGRLPCIRCKKNFTTVAALIAHMETAKNCPIRETEGFQRALGQITGGIMDFHTRSGMFVINKSSVRKLFDLRSQSIMRLEENKTKYFDPYVLK